MRTRLHLLTGAVAVLSIGCATPNRYLPGPDGGADDVDAAPAPGSLPSDGAIVSGDARTLAPDAGAPADGPCGTPDDIRNCGTCGHDCTRLTNVRVGASVQCEAGKCVIPAAACTDGYGHCSSSPDDGCETSLVRPQSCGSCSTVCSGAASMCTNTGGTYGCASGCAAPTPDACSGTCANLQTDLQNCGKCGTVCTLPNAQPKCEGGSCKVAACRTGYGDCNGIQGDGCEVNLQGTDRANCGACNFACPGSQPCVNGTCVGDCMPNSKRCSPSGNAVQTCSGQGSWVDSTTCSLGCDATSKTCLTCLPKTEDCTNGQDDDCDGKTDCADTDCGNGKTCGADKVCNNGACVGCKAGLACPTDVCKITDCSTGTQQCIATSTTNGASCGATTCNVGMKKVYACNSGSCGETRTTCDGNCNSAGTDCQPCGGQNQECCQGKCNAGLGCLGSVCKPCGQAGQPCCPVNSCSSSSLVCSGADGYIRNGTPVHDSSALCGHCGGLHEICCPGYGCQSGLSCLENAGVYCEPSCGQNSGDACCISPAGRSCRVGLTCDNAQFAPRCQ